MDGIHQVGDLVLRRADGLIAYHLATAVDELALGISDVVRGADLWSSTGAQVAVMGVLGHAPPRYGHVPLWHDKQGQRLSKREGSAGLAGLRAQGLDAPGVIGLLAANKPITPGASRPWARSPERPADPSRLLRRWPCLSCQRGTWP